VFFVHQRTGAYAPYSDFDFDRSPEGSWEDGGWNCAIRVKGDADQDEFPDNALCVLWAETFWDDEEYYIVDGYNSILVGYITSESVTKELDTGFVIFELATIHKMLKNARSLSVGLEYNTSPDTWWKMDDLTVARAVHHVWRIHSTLFTMCDVYLPILTSNTQLLKAVDDFEGGNFYSMVDNFTYQHSIFAHVVCNKHGQIYVEQDWAMLDDTDRAAGTVAVLLNDRDRRGPVDIDISRKTPEEISHAIVSGTYYNGTDAIPVIAQAPGYVPSPWGDGQASFERLVMESQSYANMIAGRVIAVANEKIQDVDVPLAGNWLTALDIAPQNWVQLNIPVADTKRGISLVGNYHLRNIVSDINIDGGSCLVDLKLVPESFGPDGVPGPYPDDYPWPTFPPPDFPDFPPWAFPSWNTLMVRNEYNDGVSNYLPYQGTVINDPSSILPALSGAQTTNLLASSTFDHPVEFVSDGLNIYFHNWEFSPVNLQYRIYQHNIATGLSSYLEFPSDGGNASFQTLNVIDVGIVCAAVWTLVGGDDAFILYEMNFNTGTVTAVYTYVDSTIISWAYILTVQSTVNVYTVMVTAHVDLTAKDHHITHRYNWTTGVSDSLETWRNDNIWQGSDYGPFPPIVASYEIYNGVNENITSPKGKGYINWFNFVTREYGSKLIHHSNAPTAISFFHSGYYRDLHRIYFMVREYTGNYYIGAYISTLTKEVSYIGYPADDSSPNEIYKMIGNKNKCWRMDWYNDPSVVFYDLATDEARPIGQMIDDFGDFWYWHPKVWSAQVDDIDERIWSYQNGYIIGQPLPDSDDAVIIAETGITAPTGPNWDLREDYLFVLGRTFIVQFMDWNSGYRMYYVVSYPGSLVIG
jgi:hypothetical protein